MNTPLDIETCKRIAHLFPDAEYWWVEGSYVDDISISFGYGVIPKNEVDDLLKNEKLKHSPCPSLEELIEKLPYIIMGRHLIIMKNLNVYEVGYWSPKPLIEDGLEPDVYRDYYKDLYSEDKDPKVACAKLLMKLEEVK